MNRLDLAFGFFQRVIMLAKRQVGADLDQKFGLGCTKSAGEYVSRRDSIGRQSVRCKDRASQTVCAKFFRQRRENPPDFPSNDGLTSRMNRCVLNRISCRQAFRYGARIFRQMTAVTPRCNKLVGNIRCYHGRSFAQI